MLIQLYCDTVIHINLIAPLNIIILLLSVCVTDTHPPKTKNMSSIWDIISTHWHVFTLRQTDY